MPFLPLTAGRWRFEKEPLPRNRPGGFSVPVAASRAKGVPRYFRTDLTACLARSTICAFGGEKSSEPRMWERHKSNQSNQINQINQ